MGFLDRFKKLKEQEIESGVSTETTETASVPEGKKTELKKKAVTEDKTTPKVKRPSESTEKKVEAVKKPSHSVASFLVEILLEPVVSEKTTRLASKGTYAFWVEPRATRTQVRQAVAAWYGVQPRKVRMLCARRKPVRFGKVKGFQKARKKALVTLPAGQHLDAYEGV